MVLETFIKLLKVFGNNDKMRDFTMSVVKSQIFKQLQNSFTKDLNKADFSNNFIFKATSDSLLLYIHIPFCSTLCTICKFNRTKNMKLMEPYVESLVKDIKTRFINQPDIKNKKVLACYFGGGTPSLLSNELLEKIISTLKDTFTFDNETQISIEGNPESLSDEFIKSCKKLNVSRISIGGQSFNQKILDKMNRKHSASMMKDVIKRIKNEGLSYSMDYVYGWDFQTEEDMIEDIQTGIDLGIPHFSLYNLTPGLPGKLYNRNKELIKNMHKLYDAARETL
ncbi:MAG TPA: radical SAM protein, partial [Spirochaetota bacterium]|nr:radical SAM protein [Spirochaetota bacterium]